MRYAHLSSEFTKEEIECMNGLTAGRRHKCVRFSEGSQ